MIQEISRKQLTGYLVVHYSIPDNVRVSKECNHLLSRIFVADPEKRISIPEIEKQPWFLENYVSPETMSVQSRDTDEYSSQSIEEALAIIREARKADEPPKMSHLYVGGSMDLDEIDTDEDSDDDRYK